MVAAFPSLAAMPDTEGAAHLLSMLTGHNMNMLIGHNTVQITNEWRDFPFLSRACQGPACRSLSAKADRHNFIMADRHSSVMAAMGGG
jgi:hypothetical protein